MANKTQIAVVATLGIVLGASVPTAIVSSQVQYTNLHVVDGDTVGIDMKTLPENLQHIKIRVFGIDTPEKGFRAQCDSERELADKASAFTKEKLQSAKDIDIQFVKWDKFGGRILGKVIIDGKDLSGMLINGGYARAYYGDKKKSWCN